MIWITGGILIMIFVFFGFSWFGILTAAVALYFLGSGLGGAERGCQKLVNYSKQKQKGIKS